MSGGDILIIVMVVVGIIAVGIYFLNKWAYKRMDEQQTVIERTKQSATIFVIDKSRGKMSEANFPKSVVEQMPKTSKFLKMYFVKAKVGPQIVTLICEKDVFNALPVKKNVKVELAGIYITSMKGMKSKEEMKEIAQAKKEKEKAEKKNAKKEAK
ncbi:hypothetical protein LJB89_00685 [Tyzzerella sp. OttesenSCG-928-J15]|nr:hypothetical protein [Tyzzerella sp. OttesenSCG-928-J15]